MAILTGEAGSLVVQATVLLWLLASWTSLSALVLEEGPRVAGLVVGASASPEQLAVKMVALVARFDDAAVFGALDWITSAQVQPPAVGSGGFGEEGSVTAPPSSGELVGAVVAVFSVVLTQTVAAAIVVMIALPKLLVVICLAVGPFAVAAYLGDSQLAREFVEGWAETTASAMLALPSRQRTSSRRSPTISRCCYSSRSSCSWCCPSPQAWCRAARQAPGRSWA